MRLLRRSRSNDENGEQATADHGRSPPGGGRIPVTDLSSVFLVPARIQRLGRHSENARTSDAIPLAAFVVAEAFAASTPLMPEAAWSPPSANTS